MQLKLVLIFGLIGFVACRAANNNGVRGAKQRLLDEIAESSTESPLRANKSQANAVGDLEAENAQSKPKRPARINSKQTKFPVDDENADGDIDLEQNKIEEESSGQQPNKLNIQKQKQQQKLKQQQKRKQQMKLKQQQQKRRQQQKQQQKRRNNKNKTSKNKKRPQRKQQRPKKRRGVKKPARRTKGANRRNRKAQQMG